LLSKRTYPKQVLIAGKPYSIAFVATIKDADTRGQCDIEDKIILIQKDLGEKETFETLIHEVLHALEFELKIKITHKAVYSLETGISGFLLDNLYLFFKD
jgi:hypothetical protein